MIEINHKLKLVQCPETGKESRVFSVAQWNAFEAIFTQPDRFVSLDEIADAVYTDEEILNEGVSDEAIRSIVRRARHRIADASPQRQYIVGKTGWGYRFVADGVLRKAKRCQ